MQVEPTETERAAMAARGWEWRGWRELFIPSHPALSKCADIRPVNTGWEATVGDRASGGLPLLEAADWAGAELRRVVMRSPIFRDPNAPRWERRDSLWALVVGVDTVVVMADKSRSGQCFLGRAYYLGPAWDSFATTKDLAAELARRGLPPLPEGAWEAE